MYLGSVGTQTTTYIAGVRAVTTGSETGITVLIDANGQLGTVSSSIKKKENIVTIDKEKNSNIVKGLRACRFNYISDESNTLTYGMMAEETAEVDRDLVYFDNSGDPETIYYQHLPIILLAEVQLLQKIIFELTEK